MGGNTITLTAADGTYFYYAHLSTFADGIAVGSEVVAGQVIGYVVGAIVVVGGIVVGGVVILHPSMALTGG